MYKQGLKVHDFEMTKHLVGIILFIIILQSPFIPRSEKELSTNLYDARRTPLLGLLVKSAHYLFHN